MGLKCVQHREQRRRQENSTDVGWSHGPVQWVWG